MKLYLDLQNEHISRTRQMKLRAPVIGAAIVACACICSRWHLPARSRATSAPMSARSRSRARRSIRR